MPFFLTFPLHFTTETLKNSAGERDHSLGGSTLRTKTQGSRARVAEASSDQLLQGALTSHKRCRRNDKATGA